MCECGCGEQAHPVAFFPGPDGITYGLALYGGCRDCGNGVAVILHRIPESEMEHFGPKGWHGQVPWVTPKWAGWDEWWLRILDPDKLVAAMRGELDVPNGYIGEEAVADLRWSFIQAVRESSAEDVRQTRPAPTTEEGR